MKRNDEHEVDMTLPKTIEDISSYAFANAKSLRSIKLNDEIVAVGENAFAGCTNLKSVNIPTSLKYLQMRMFMGCTALNSIDIPSNIESIRISAFEGCTNLFSVNPDSYVEVYQILRSAFQDCSILKYIRFSENLHTIRESAFRNCANLTEIIFPANLQVLEDWAFAGTGLKQVTVNRATPIKINANVFDGVELKKCILFVPEGCVEAYQNAEVWKKFGNILEIGTELKPVPTGNVKIGKLKYILRSDFTAEVADQDQEDPDLSGAIEVPASFTYEGYTFTVTKMYKWAFYACKDITSVILPATITEIAQQAFDGCNGLTSVTLPSSLTKIGKWAFQGCNALTSISIPSTVTEIASNAFVYCNNLSSVSIPSGVSVIPECCFESCTNLKTVSLNEGLTEIKDNAFANTDLRSVTLPESVTQLGKNVFTGCANLASIKALSTTAPEALSSTFSKTITDNCILYVPQGSKDNFIYETGWEDFKNVRENGVNAKIQYGYLYYRIFEDGTAYVTFETDDANNYKGLYGEITVDDVVWYEGLDYKVTAVGPNAFANSKNITKINLPEIMDEIHAYAFRNTNLYDINIPATLERLSYTAFDGSFIFTSYMNDQHSVYFDGCLLYHEPDYIPGTYKVQEGTRLIASGVFSGDNKIYELVLPESVKCICKNAIDYMGWLHFINIPESVDFLQDGFLSSYCPYLETIYCYQKEPIDLTDLPDVFAYWSDEDLAKITLYVPYGTKKAYKKAYKWKEFNIVEMDPIYTVTFKDYDDNELKTEEVSKGNDATAPDDPEREGYTFTGWDVDFTNVQEDLTVTAEYTANTYTVVFVDGETGDEIESQTIEYGKSATEPEEMPNHEEDGRVFDNWDADFDVIKEDLTVTAQYKTMTFTVTFLGYEDVLIDEQIVEWDQSAKTPDVPEVEGHVFMGWDQSYTHVKSDLTIHAKYEAETFYVVFYDRKGGIISDQDVEYGNAASEPVPPTYIGYTFVGWDVDFSYVTEDLEVHALYEISKYYVEIVAIDGSVTVEPEKTDLMNVEHGTTLKLTAVPNDGYEFVKWTAGDYELKMITFNLTVTSDTTVTANFQIQTFEVTFLDKDGEQIGETQIIEWNQSADEPEAPEVEGYNFIGWDKDFDHVQENLTVQAQYQIKTFTVKFQDSFGNTIETQVVEWDKSATAPEAPEKEGYHFIGWSMDYTHVKEDMSVYAKYEINTYKVTIIAEHGTVSILPKELDLEKVKHGEVLYLEAEPDEGYEFVGWTNYEGSLLTITSDTTVTATFKIKSFEVIFQDYDEKELKSETVEYGQSATPPDEPEREGWIFTGWDTAFDNVTEDLVITALYEQKPDDPTGVESIQPLAVSIQKVLREGVIYIEREGKLYDLNGRQVN